MKFIILFNIALLGFIGIVKSQIIDNVSFKIGANLANTNFRIQLKPVGLDNTIDYKNEIGYRSSIQFGLFEKKFVEFVPEFGFLQNTSSTEVLGGTENFTRNCKFEYVFANMQIKGKLIVRNFVPYIALGLNINYLLNQDSGFEKSTGLFKIIYGYNYSFGIGYKIQKFIIFLESMKCHDLKYVVNYIDNFTTVKIKHQPLSFNFGITYKLK